MECLCYEFTANNQITGYCLIHKTLRDKINEVVFSYKQGEDIFLPELADKLWRALK
mgnify:CR=1